MKALYVFLHILANCVLITTQNLMNLINGARFLLCLWCRFFVLLFIFFINLCKHFFARFKSSFENGSLRNFSNWLHPTSWGRDFCIIHFFVLKKGLRTRSRHLIYMIVYLFSEQCNKVFEDFLIAIQTLERYFATAFDLINSNLEPDSRDVSLSLRILTHSILLLNHGCFINWQTIEEHLSNTKWLLVDSCGYWLLHFNYFEAGWFTDNWKHLKYLVWS